MIGSSENPVRTCIKKFIQQNKRREKVNCLKVIVYTICKSDPRNIIVKIREKIKR